MATFQISGPDGAEYEVEAPDEHVAAQAYRQLTASAPTNPETPGIVESFLRGAEQGATLGFGDEVRGLLAASPMRADLTPKEERGIAGAAKQALAWNVRNSPLGLLAQGVEGAHRYFTGAPGAGAEYDSAVTENRQDLARAREAHPYVTAGGEVAGGVAATLPTMLAAPAAFGAAGSTMARQVGAGLASGAVLGGAQGAGQGEGGIKDRAANAIVPAAAGGVVGAAAAPIAAAVGRGAQALTALAPQSVAGLGRPASREALNALREAGPEAVQARLAELGPEGMLLDAAQPFLGRAQGLASTPGAPGARVVGALRTRDAGTDARLARGLEEAVGPAPIPSEVEAQFVTRRAAAGDMYERALAWRVPVDTSAALAEIGSRLGDAAGPERIALLRARDLLTEQGRDGVVQRTGARYLHNAKGALDDLIQYGDPTIGVPRGALSREDGALSAVRRRLNEAIEEAVPGYREANLAHRTATRASEALDSGRRVLGGGDAAIHPADFAADLARRPIEQQAALRAGVRADLDRTVGNAANDLSALAGELKRPADWNRQKLNAAFGPEAVDAAARTVDANAAMRQSFNDVARGSQTAQRQRGAEAVGVRDLAPKAGDAGVAAVAGVVGGPAAAAVPYALKSGRFGLNAIGRASDQTRNEQLADLLTRQGEARDAAVARLLEVLTGQAGRATAAEAGGRAATQSLLGSGVRERDAAAFWRDLLSAPRQPAAGFR